ncbi:hypothetical protein PROFUN_00835 [Planoprotostelium fungivorum]|uniref:Uncharacterized protein n=1 Tax=Planoprotostelium fungivorum TaxID=1890364 RepID=A0A2P6P041_9EUKA|nr:hypothetical protein PROFUN_00835 [Planoprotostelium fungivorum]
MNSFSQASRLVSSTRSLHRVRINNNTCSRKVSIDAITPEEQVKKITQRRKDLPVSPHVSIYKFPAPALSSIANRATSAALTAGLAGASAIVLLKSPADLTIFLESIKSHGALLPVVKGTVAFPFVYHTLAAIRHLYWDYTSKGLDLVSVQKSSIALGASSGVIAVALADERDLDFTSTNQTIFGLINWLKSKMKRSESSSSTCSFRLCNIPLTSSEELSSHPLSMLYFTWHLTYQN